ncbi:MAG: GNAT family N-acetyltransferase [Anaerolineales bacterium]|nr:GNAT family N-acetyltransferase [Anaerolineales bacterium]
MSEIHIKTLKNRSFQIQEMPSIPGLVLRFFRGKADYPYIKEVFDRCKNVDGYKHSLSEEEIANHFRHLHNCDPFKDMIFIEINKKVIGYSRVMWYKENTGDIIYPSLGFIDPEWRRKGIGSIILKYNEQRLREIARNHPPESHKYFQNDVIDEQPGRVALLNGMGYKPIRYEYGMVRPIDAPLPNAPMPKGLETRPATPDQYRQIFEASNEAFRDHWGFREMTEEDYQREIASNTFQPQLWKVAWDGKQVAGMVLNFINKDENIEYKRQRGYTEGISVRRPWRRRGLARSLLVQSIQMFKEMGMEETALGVDTQNPSGALRLYEDVGYTVVHTETIYRKPFKST